MFTCNDQIKQVFFIFNTWELLSEHKLLKALTLVGPTRENLKLDPFAVLHLDNQLYIKAMRSNYI